MAKDSNGVELQPDDVVTVRCRVLQANENSDYATVAILLKDGTMTQTTTFHGSFTTKEPTNLKPFED